MRPGDLVEIVCSHNNGGAPWPRGGPGVCTFDVPQKQRWFPNGTWGLVIGRTFPKTVKSDWHRKSMYEVLIDGEVHTMFNRDLRVINEAR